MSWCETFSVCHVFLQVAVRRTSLSVLATVGLPFPAAVLLAPHTVRASQVGQTLGRHSLLALVCRAAAVRPLCAEVVDVVAQVLQVEGPGAELLPVHPLEGHDAVQVAPHLWAGKAFFQLALLPSHVNVSWNILKAPYCANLLLVGF